MVVQVVEVSTILVMSFCIWVARCLVLDADSSDCRCRKGFLSELVGTTAVCSIVHRSKRFSIGGVVGWRLRSADFASVVS